MSDDQELHDSGTRSSFDSGAVRDGAVGKGRMDLLPVHAIHRWSRHMEKGAVKYEDRNWEKGMPQSIFLKSAMNHIMKFSLGLQDEDHLAAAFWNLGAMMHQEEMMKRGILPAELNDLTHNHVTDEERKNGLAGWM